jgi:hypothetical protein
MPFSAIATPTHPDRVNETTDMMASSFCLRFLNNMARGIIEKLAMKKPMNW